MSLKQNDEWCESMAEALAENVYWRAKADEFLTDVAPQFSTPILEYVVSQLETELREREEARDQSFGCPF